MRGCGSWSEAGEARSCPSRRRLAIAVFATVAATGALAVAGSGGPVDGHGQAAAAAQSRPNVVVIESDDQTVESMRVMNRVNSLIGDKGATFQQQLRQLFALLPVARHLPHRPVRAQP